MFMSVGYGNMTKTILAAALSFLAVLALTGCGIFWSIPGKPGNCEIQLKIKASDKVNMDRNGKSLPTPVRFYQLKGVNNLKGAGFEDLWNAEDILGDEMIHMHEVVVYPSQKHTEKIEIQEETNYMAIAAIFREPDGDTWRTYTKLPPWGA